MLSNLKAEINLAFLLTYFLILCRLNDTSFVKTNYIDTLWLVRGFGTSSKEALIKKIPYTVYTWLQKDIDKKIGRNAWYNAPVAIMSQLLYPVNDFET